MPPKLPLPPCTPATAISIALPSTATRKRSARALPMDWRPWTWRDPISGSLPSYGTTSMLPSPLSRQLQPWADYPSYDPSLVEEALTQTLYDLRLDYLVLWLMHWPVGNAPDTGKTQLDYLPVRTTRSFLRYLLTYTYRPGIWWKRCIRPAKSIILASPTFRPPS